MFWIIPLVIALIMFPAIALPTLGFIFFGIPGLLLSLVAVIVFALPTNSSFSRYCR
jgi:hypothetical protein